MLHAIREIWPTVTQLQLLLITFGIYLCIIIAFGVTYFLLYSNNPDRFFIPAEIVASQKRYAKATFQHTINKFSIEIHAMEEVRKSIEEGKMNWDDVVLPNGHRVKTESYTMVGPQGQSQDRLHLRVINKNGKRLCDVEGPQDEDLTRDYFIRWLRQMITVWRERREKARSGYDPQRTFTILDFMYFSGITQTTVGYGDMLPNSTAIRMLVLLQVLLGVVLLVVVLNLVLIG